MITDRPPDDEAPVLPWDLFATRIFRWGQDQHVGIIGPTEQGKSNLAYHLLQRRSYVAYMGIKSRDKTLDSFARQGGYQRIYDWPPKQGHIRKRPVPWEDMPRRLVWPDATNRRGSRETQRQVFTRMLDDCWRGYACVVWDDFWYLVRILGMELDAKQNLLNARSAESAQVIIAQRGGGNRMVELYDQPTHLFFAAETDESNLERLGPRSSPRRRFVQHLDRYQFLYENTREHWLYRVTAPLLGQQ